MTAGELLSTLAHQGVVALRQTLNKLAGLGGVRRCGNLLKAGSGGPVGDVLAYRAMKQEYVLAYQSDAPSQAVQLQAFNRLTVE